MVKSFTAGTSGLQYSVNISSVQTSSSENIALILVLRNLKTLITQVSLLTMMMSREQKFMS